MVLGRDTGKGLRLVAISLEVELSDPAEDPGKAAGRIAFLGAVGCVEENVADLVAGRDGHLLGADDENKTCAAGGDRIGRGMDRSGARGTGILHPGCWTESQIGMGLESEGGGKGLLLEAAEIADIDGVD